MKIFFVMLLLAVLGALAGAGVFMLRRRPTGEQPAERGDASMARALALRVALSIAAFVLVLVAWALGWIQPSGIPIR